jgi:hypothetical protein
MCALVGIVGVKLGEWDSCVVFGRSISWYLAKVGFMWFGSRLEYR